MSHNLRILHLSDLHERVALDWMKDERKAKIRTDAAKRYRVLGDDHFFDKLSKIIDTAPIDLICFTGDVAGWGLPEEYPKVTKRFEDTQACKRLSKKGKITILAGRPRSEGAGSIADG